MQSKKNTIFILTTYLVDAWYEYWALRSKYLPDFATHLLKGSLVYVTLITCVTYAAAWFIYRVPPTEHPAFVVGSTLLSVFADFPSFIVRLVFEAPIDLSYEQILWDASSGYIKNYWDFVMTCSLISLMTLGYIVFLFKSALYYRRSVEFWDSVLATVVLGLLCLSALALIYYVLAPFVVNSLKEGFAFQIVRVFWRFVAWIQSLHPNAEQRRQAYHKADTSDTFDSTKSKSSTSSRI